MADSEWLQNPRPNRPGTVPKDAMVAPVQPQAYPGPSQDIPMQVPHGQSVPPAKPSVKTGPGGSGASIPVPGKGGA